MGKTLADGYLELRVDPSKLDAETKKAFKAIGFRQRGQQAGAEVGSGMAQGFERQAGALAKAAAATAARLTVLGAAAGAAAPGMVQFTAALAPAAGAALALPAALLAIKAATGTVKLAVAGVGDAIETGFTGTAKEAAAALEKLPPGARAFAREVIALKGPLAGLRAQVSGRFFDPLVDEIGPLAGRYLPLLRTQMPALAESIGRVGESAVRAAQRATVFSGVRKVFTETREGIDGARQAVGPLVEGFGALLRVGAPMLQRLGESAGTVGERFGRFLVTAEKTGRLKEALQGGISTLKDLGAIAGNVGSIFRSVFGAANASGNSLLANLRELTGQAAAFLQSGQGGSALTAVFGTLAQLGQAMRTALGAVLPAVAQSVQALAPAMGSLAPAIAQVVVAIAPLLPYITQIAAQMLQALVPAITALAGWLQSNEGAMRNFAIALGVAYAAMKVYAVYSAVATAATKAHTVATNLNTTATKIWNSTFVIRLRTWALDAAAMIRSTAATVANTVASTANRIATAVSTVTLQAFVAVKTFEYGTWIRTTAATIANTAAMVAHRVAAIAANVASKAMAAGIWLVNIALRANPIGLVITAITALIAIVVLAYKRNETFRNIVNAVWSSVKTAIKAVGDWFVNTLWPSLKRAYEQLAAGFGWLKDKVVAAWNLLRSGIDAGWAFLRDKIFVPLQNFIFKTIPDAFRTGVSNIARIWDGLKSLAAKPVRFVVDTVINQGIIGTFNKVSGFFGGPKASTVSLPSGFGDGPGHHGAPAGPRTGDGPGDILGFLKGPANWIRDKVAGPIGRIGDHPFGKMLTGMGGKLVDSLIEKAKSLIGGSEYAGGGVGANGLQAGISGALAALRAAFGSVPLISGLRPGSRTLSGNTSYHASGRAIDIAPVRAWAAFLNAAFGPQLKELITPWQDLNLHHGRPHTYTGAVWRQHNFSGGNAHIHAAMDDGGMRVLRPGYNVIPNWTGAMEPIAGPNAMAAIAGRGDIHIHIHDSVIASAQHAEDLVVAGYNAARKKRRIP